MPKSRRGKKRTWRNPRAGNPLCHCLCCARCFHCEPECSYTLHILYDVIDIILSGWHLSLCEQVVSRQFPRSSDRGDSELCSQRRLQILNCWSARGRPVRHYHGTTLRVVSLHFGNPERGGACGALRALLALRDRRASRWTGRAEGTCRHQTEDRPPPERLRERCEEEPKQESRCSSK